MGSQASAITPESSNNNDDVWPMAKLKTNLQKALATATADTKFVVLVVTGSLSPPHKGHVSILNECKAALEKPNVVVVAAFLSASHDLYLDNKMKQQPLGCDFTPIPGKHRVHMARIACSGSRFADASSFEISQPDFVDFPGVCVAAKQFITAAVREDPTLQEAADRLQFWYGCGADHAFSCHLHTQPQPWCDGVVALGRPGTAASDTTRDHADKDGACYYRYVAIGANVPDISSTAVRMRLVDQDDADDLNRMMDREVLNYMRKYHVQVKRRK